MGAKFVCQKDRRIDSTCAELQQINEKAIPPANELKMAHIQANKPIRSYGNKFTRSRKICNENDSSNYEETEKIDEAKLDHLSD